MGDGLLLPLFPLPVVLFPRAPLPLHIFEERYRLMVGAAVRDHSEFGVVLIDDGKVSTAGCTAIVENVVKRYQDGRFDVTTTGRRRYRTLSLNQSKPYLQAAVEFFDDQDDSPPDAIQLERVARLGRRVCDILHSDWPDLEGETQPSFVIANHLPLDLDFKQQLLVKRSENERLEALADTIDELAQRLARIRDTQRVARTNGQAGGH
jgi:Lon protease-like protein